MDNTEHNGGGRVIHSFLKGLQRFRAIQSKRQTDVRLVQFPFKRHGLQRKFQNHDPRFQTSNRTWRALHAHKQRSRHRWARQAFDMAVVPEKLERHFGLSIQFRQDSSTANLFVVNALSRKNHHRASSRIRVWRHSDFRKLQHLRHQLRLRVICSRKLRNNAYQRVCLRPIRIAFLHS